MTHGNEKEVSTFWLKDEIRNFAIGQFEAEASRLQR